MCLICNDIVFPTAWECKSHVEEQHSGISYKCLVCFHTFLRRPARHYHCNVGASDLVYFHRETGQKGMAAEEKMEEFRKGVADLVREVTEKEAGGEKRKSEDEGPCVQKKTRPSLPFFKKRSASSDSFISLGLSLTESEADNEEDGADTRKGREEERKQREERRKMEEERRKIEGREEERKQRDERRDAEKREEDKLKEEDRKRRGEERRRDEEKKRQDRLRDEAKQREEHRRDEEKKRQDRLKEEDRKRRGEERRREEKRLEERRKEMKREEETKSRREAEARRESDARREMEARAEEETRKKREMVDEREKEMKTMQEAEAKKKIETERKSEEERRERLKRAGDEVEELRLAEERLMLETAEMEKELARKERERQARLEEMNVGNEIVPCERGDNQSQASVKEGDRKEKDESRVKFVLEKMKGESDERLVLNVGGERLETTRTTLLECEGSCLGALVKQELPPYGKKEFFFDRDPTTFRHILNFCRSRGCFKVSVLPRDLSVLHQLCVECQFYNMCELEELVLKRMSAIFDFL